MDVDARGRAGNPAAKAATGDPDVGVAGAGVPLGSTAARVRVRPVTEEEAFLLGALHLQALLREDRAPGPGRPSHVQAFAQQWAAHAPDLPAWVAECDGEHVGLVVCRLPLLPRVGRANPELVVLEALGELPREAVALALVRAVVTWFGREGFYSVDVAPEVGLPPAVLDAARADITPQHRVSLPTRP